jgi:voltage-gated potassium channel
MMGRRFRTFIAEIVNRTLFLQMVALLVSLWLAFAAAMFMAERGVEGSSIRSFGDAMYWGIAALSTAGIAESPITGTSKVIGGFWTSDQLIETIEYSLEELDQLSVEELDLLKETVDTLIEHVERIKSQRQ